MSKLVRRCYPREWQLRHSVERKVRSKLAQLPSLRMRGGLPARRSGIRTANQLLNQSAAVIFVTLFIILGFTVFATIFSFVMWYLIELSSEVNSSSFTLVTHAQEVVNSVWNLFLCFLFEGHVTLDSRRKVLEAISVVVNSLSQTFNRTRVH